MSVSGKCVRECVYVYGKCMQLYVGEYDGYVLGISKGRGGWGHHALRFACSDAGPASSMD
jgi:hypothetical protein